MRGRAAGARDSIGSTSVGMAEFNLSQFYNFYSSETFKRRNPLAESPVL
jgi:hypothetical protein